MKNITDDVIEIVETRLTIGAETFLKHLMLENEFPEVSLILNNLISRLSENF